MASRFQTKIIKRRVRIDVVGVQPDAIIRIGNALTGSIIERLLRAEDVHDAPAPPLKARIVNGKDTGYAGRKARKAPPAIRNWRFTGRTHRSMKVLRAEINKGVIGFTDAVTNRRAYLNNRRWRQFGVSPRDREALVNAIRREQIVRIKAA